MEATAITWIRTPEAVRDLAVSLAGTGVVALDSESDSLYHYREKVCLIQLATEAGAVFLIDPLAVRDLSPLAPLGADPGVVKIFHGADYDITSMKRDFGFSFANIFDTMIAGRFLGLAETGLEAMLRKFLGIALGASLQKADWSRRPLTPKQEAYAAADVRHLIPLWRCLREALRDLDREAWVFEECQAVAAIPALERTVDPDAFLGVKGSGHLDGRGLAILRELFLAREAWARQGDRPAFKVLGNETLLRLALEAPTRPEGLPRIPGCSPKVVGRYSTGILEAIARGKTVPEQALPRRRGPSRPRVPPDVQRRATALKSWRSEASLRLNLDAGLLLPQRLITRLAAEPPPDLAALGQVEGIRRWRVEAFGQQLLAMIGSERSADRLRASGAGDRTGLSA